MIRWGIRRWRGPAAVHNISRVRVWPPAGAAAAVRSAAAPVSRPVASAVADAGVGPAHPQRLARALVHAARAFDADAISVTVRDLLKQHGVVRTWEDVLVPALTSAGQRS